MNWYKKEKILKQASPFASQPAGIPVPDWADYITVDQIAETTDNLPESLYSKLWTFVDEAEQTLCPHNGIMPGETCPQCGRNVPEWEDPDSYDNQALSLKKFWNRLTPEEQMFIVNSK